MDKKEIITILNCIDNTLLIPRLKGGYTELKEYMDIHILLNTVINELENGESTDKKHPNWEAIHNQLLNELELQTELIKEDIDRQIQKDRQIPLRGSIQEFNDILIKKQYLKYINGVIKGVEYEPVKRGDKNNTNPNQPTRKSIMG